MSNTVLVLCQVELSFQLLLRNSIEWRVDLVVNFKTISIYVSIVLRCGILVTILTKHSTPLHHLADWCQLFL